jgi:hypothetical protein
VFNVENVGGRIRFMDGQNGVADASGYFANGGNTRFVRLDDLPLGNTNQFVTKPKP